MVDITPRRKFEAMARWVVECPNCKHTFTHTPIEPTILAESLRDPFRVLPKPTIPQDSAAKTCPDCHTTSVFKPFELFYRNDSENLPFGF